MILATFDDSSAILLTIVFVIITLALCGLIFLSIQRNIAREKEEKNIIVENAVSKRALVDSVNSYIKRIDRFGVFTLMSIDIDGFGCPVFHRIALCKLAIGYDTRIIGIKQILVHTRHCAYHYGIFLSLKLLVLAFTYMPQSDVYIARVGAANKILVVLVATF